MQRAFELALNGMGHVSPNPMVGCVVVHNGLIIGEGWHMKYGGPHAEVNAINSVKDKSLLSDATVFVTLEPCSHHGLTPPCSDLLISSGVKKVVIGNMDPNPKVLGKGIQKLRDSGVEVNIGQFPDQGEEVNKRFFTYHRMKRPFIILKWAETADGFIAHENYDSKWISNDCSRQLVHRWRAEEDAVLVGKNTALYDDPALTVRDAAGKNPVRIVIDHKLQLPHHLQLFDHSIPTICYNLSQDKDLANLEYVKLEEGRFEDSLLTDLYNRKIISIIIEGGRSTLQSFIDKNLWDEARIFKSKGIFKKGIKAPRMENAVLLNNTNILEDQLQIFRISNG